MSLSLIVVSMRYQRKENFCSACVHFVEDLDLLLSVLFLRKATFLSVFDLWLRPWGVAQLLGLSTEFLCAQSQGNG